MRLRGTGETNTCEPPGSGENESCEAGPEVYHETPRVNGPFGEGDRTRG